MLDDVPAPLQSEMAAVALLRKPLCTPTTVGYVTRVPDTMREDSVGDCCCPMPTPPVVTRIRSAPPTMCCMLAPEEL
jgi:hypothetical protein